MPKEAVDVVLGLGGNLGDPVAAMADVINALSRHNAIEITDVSKLYKTPPWGKLDQPDFINSCVLIKTDLAPEALLDLCLSLEKGLKRERLERWGPRTIDIDILLYGDRHIQTDRLSVPHPRMLERAFVLKPLVDLGPQRPISGKAAKDWLSAHDEEGIEAISNDGDWWR